MPQWFTEQPGQCIRGGEDEGPSSGNSELGAAARMRIPEVESMEAWPSGHH